MCKSFHLEVSLGCAVNIYPREVFSALNLSSLGCKPCRFALYQHRAKNDWLVTYLMLYARQSSLVYRCHQCRQLGTKMVVLMVNFLSLSNTDFYQTGQEIE